VDIDPLDIDPLDAALDALGVELPDWARLVPAKAAPRINAATVIVA
jgi:hypothetical protein